MVQFANTGPSLADIVAGEQERQQEKKKDPMFDITGRENRQFYEEEVIDYNVLVDNIEAMVRNGLIAAGEQYGYSKSAMDQLFWGNWTIDGALGFLDSRLQNAEQKRTKLGAILPEDDLAGVGPDELTMGAGYYAKDADGFNDILTQVWNWYNGKVPFDLEKAGQPTRGSGGSGRSTPNIRGQFDVEALAGNAQDLWRQWLLEETPDARKFAQQYVDAVVATGGEQKIDFRTFIENKAKATARWGSIYRNKPESLAPEAFLQRYFQTAQQVARPGNAADIAIGGAQMGADLPTFGQRLRRTEESQTSASYINELGARTQALSGILRG